MLDLPINWIRVKKKLINPSQFISFYTAVEKLKATTRHSWLSTMQRQESVAEHSWMMSLLALVLLPHMEQKLDALKVLRMIIIHDLAEAVTKDMPVWQGVENKQKKLTAEATAITELLQTLDSQTRYELLELWQEYEARTTNEAKFVKALDTLDVVAQHNVASSESWDDNDYLWQLSPLQDKFFNIDEVLRKLKDEIDRWTVKKVASAGKLEKLDQTELKKLTK